MSWLEIAGGIALLFAAGEAFVRGAVGLAKRAGVSSLLIGLTVVALGTSSPEFFVSLEAVLSGKAQIAIATVTGSNLIDLTLVLGIASMFAPLVFSRGRFAFESAALVGSALILAILALVGAVARIVGIAMVLLILVYIAACYVRDRRGRGVRKDWHAEECEEFAPFPPVWPAAGLAAAGLGGLVLGAHFVVTGAEQIALGLGASQTVIGLTIVAAGSSLPELATSLAAAVRGHTDVAIGNVLGSCIFNVLWILGLCAIVRPFAIESSLAKESIFVMLGTSIVVSLLLLARARVGRFAGAVLSLAYAAYVVIFVRAS
jgi:cation:H+ antiporter